MADGTQVLAAALEELLGAFGRGVAEAQLELGRSAIQLQQEIDADPELSQHGVTATWYQIPNAEMEFRVALTVSSEASPAVGRTALKAHPINAAYQNQFGFQAAAASVMRMTVLPVPPQQSVSSGTPPRMEPEAAIKSAASLLVQDAGGRALPDAKVVANYNAASRTWYVIQYTEVDGKSTTIAVVEVDDLTGRAHKRP